MEDFNLGNYKRSTIYREFHEEHTGNCYIFYTVDCAIDSRQLKQYNYTDIVSLINRKKIKRQKSCMAVASNCEIWLDRVYSKSGCSKINIK